MFLLTVSATEKGCSTSILNTAVEQHTPDPPSDPFVRWLEREKVPLFWRGGVPFRVYHRLLIPAPLKPTPVNLRVASARELLRESGASLIRWHSKTFDEPRSYWSVLCERYDFSGLDRKVRNQIRKATRECAVRRLETAWAVANTYDCYAAAFGRYKSGQPASRVEYERDQGKCVGGPFEFWGAFVGNKLAGFAKCVVSDDYVAVVAFKFDPAYGKLLPSYALVDALLKTYVCHDKKSVGNGFLSLHHETQMQDFLLKFGFRRSYCDLHVTYRPVLRLAVNICFPFRGLIDRLPLSDFISSVKSLLRQEDVRRSCLAPARHPSPVSHKEPPDNHKERSTLLPPLGNNEKVLGGENIIHNQSGYGVLSESHENEARLHDRCS